MRHSLFVRTMLLWKVMKHIGEGQEPVFIPRTKPYLEAKLAFTPFSEDVKRGAHEASPRNKAPPRALDRMDKLQ